MKSLLNIVVCFVTLVAPFAEAATVKGRVLSKADSEVLVGVNVLLQGTLRGLTTDANGDFVFANIPIGSYSLAFSMVGFRREERSITVSSADQVLEITVELIPIPIQTAPVVVTASKREQSFQDVPVSISVMDAAAISYRNAITIDDALRYIPGVNLTESQVNIRGSSGYSRGVGSRVLMLVDGIPFLTGDTGELNFESLPVSQIDRLEVVKGASSALYGSSALGGVVNVITVPISAEPRTTVRTYGGFYSEPSHKSWKWTGDPRTMHGFSVGHSRKSGDFGFVIFGSRTGDDGYRQNDFKRRYNGYLKARYDFSSINALTLTFNILDQKRTNFLYWKDLSNALTPPAIQLGDNIHSTRFFVSGLYNYVVSDGFLFVVKGMWFRNRFRSTISGNKEQSTSDVVRGEFQATWSPMKSNVLTFGIEGNLDDVRADLFGNRSGGGVALYAQDEIEIVPDLKGTVGLRFDYQQLASLEANSQLNPKAGLVYTPTTGTSIRASFGRGFRSPSVAEAFITTTSGGFPIIPNPGLKPERSYSYELGATHILGETALFDIALFRSEFSNLIEAGFTATGQGQFNNVTKARIQGLEASAKLGFFNRALFIDLGYTYVSPDDLTRNDILRYRPRHLLYTGFQVTLGVISFGADFRYISRVERIDEEFVALGIIRDGDERVATYVTDLRLGADFSDAGFPMQATIHVNNLFQYNYVELIGNLAPPRNVVLVLEAKL